jgi:flavin-dependent dehydrogenase
MADTQVLIVGAGPVGLTAVLELRRRGVRVTPRLVKIGVVLRGERIGRRARERPLRRDTCSRKCS